MRYWSGGAIYWVKEIAFSAVSLYNNDLENEDVNCPIDEVELEQDDAFWFSPTWYQTVSRSQIFSSRCHCTEKSTKLLGELDSPKSVPLLAFSSSTSVQIPLIPEISC